MDLGVAIFVLAVLAAVTVDTLWGIWQLKDLADFSPLASALRPSLSVVVAARNEETHIETAVRSLLNQAYDPFEVIVVNDRSTDKTGTILAELQRELPKLRVVTITELPSDWIGKNFALWQGASHAQGEWLLFADGDIVMEQSTFARALCAAQKLDHLALLPDMRITSPWVGIFAQVFSVLFLIFVQPWRLHWRTANFAVGIGAFNLIRRSVYDEIGSHQAIKMRPDDDVKLGKLVKLYGYRQGLILGSPLVQFEFYPSVRATIAGFMKNFFAGLEYNAFFVLLSMASLLFFWLWPILAIFVEPRNSALCYGASTGLLVLLMMGAARRFRKPLWGSLFYPFGIGLMLYIQWVSMWKTLRHRGIYWRETFYPLEALRDNRIPPRR